MVSEHEEIVTNNTPHVKIEDGIYRHVFISYPYLVIFHFIR